MMKWTAPTDGIAMCPIPTALEEPRESAVGYNATRPLGLGSSAFTRFGHLASFRAANMFPPW